jgi:hypothetical protein
MRSLLWMPSWKSKLPFSIITFGVLSLLSPIALRADTLYTYTGNPYTFCDGTYGTPPHCSAGALSVSFSTSGPLDSVTDFSVPLSDLIKVTDSLAVTITPANEAEFQLLIDTSASGAITQWSLIAGTENAGIEYGAASCFATDSKILAGTGCVDVGPGTGDNPEGSAVITASNGDHTADGSPTLGTLTAADWTFVSTPEPSSLFLLGIGLASLMGVAFFRKRQVA